MRSRAGRVLVLSVAGAMLSGAVWSFAQSPGPPPFGAPSAEFPRPGQTITAVRGDRAGNWLDQSRSEVLGRHGMVATSQSLATQAGLEILRDGGNAADAAVAAAAELALMEPESTHLGADMFALYYDAKQRRVHGLNASGWAPKAWTPEYFAAKGHDEDIPYTGADSITVPGAIDGWDKLLRRFGTMRFKQVLEPAIRDAEQGFGITERIHGDWRGGVNLLRRDPDSAETFLVGGEAPELYSIWSNPDLAHAFRVLQRKGRDAFYEGEIARAIVDKVQAAGGALTLSDLRSFESEWVDPISTTYKGFEVLQTPPNSQGFAVLEMLNILEQCGPELGLDLATLGPRSPQFWHLLIEAKKLAFTDLDAYNTDPRFVDVPVERLISKEYARSLCGRIDPERASTPSVGVDHEGGTVYVAAADRWGNMVSFIYSIYDVFGSGITVPGYGFVLHNRGALFSLDPQSPNVVAPRKRPFHTIIPAFVLKDGEPVMAFGNMGGSVQVQAQVTELVNMIDLGMNVQAAGDAARFRHDQGPNRVQLESKLFDLVGPQLAEMGHTLRRANGSVMGGYQAIHFTPDPDAPRSGRGRDRPVAGVYRGGSDLRKDGQVAGW